MKNNKDDKTLDLHDVRHDEVSRLVENFVLLNEPPLTIVYGNSDRMSLLVETTLRGIEVGYDKWLPGQLKVLKV